MDAPRIQYAKTEDGVSLAYTVTGTGPAIVLPPLLTGGWMGETTGELQPALDLFGAYVILASRTKEKAAGGEIFVTDVVRQLVAGKGFAFTDRGEMEMKGFEEPVRMYEVRWSSTDG